MASGGIFLEAIFFGAHMKKILAVMLVLSSGNAFAKSSEYCSNENRKVFYTVLNTEHIRGNLSRSSINSGELLANLPDGTSVVVPCYHNRVLSSSGVATSSLVVSQKNIFTPVKGRVVNNMRAIGYNKVSGVSLVEKTTAFFVKNYVMVKKK